MSFSRKRGNDLATVSNSVICDVLLSNNSCYAKVVQIIE